MRLVGGAEREVLVKTTMQSVQVYAINKTIKIFLGHHRRLSGPWRLLIWSSSDGETRQRQQQQLPAVRRLTAALEFTFIRLVLLLLSQREPVDAVGQSRPTPTLTLRD